MLFFEVPPRGKRLQRRTVVVDGVGAMTSAGLAPSRRCFKVTRVFGRRSPFRRPRRHVVELVTYGIAVAAEAAGVSLHEYGVEASRVRMVLSASERELEEFMRRLDEVVSGGGAFWRAAVPYQAVSLDDDAAVVEACVDVAASVRRPRA